MKKLLLLLCVCCFIKLKAQKIYFSQKDASRYDYTNNYIIGKIKNNILVLKYVELKAKLELLIYNYDMQLLKKVPADFLPGGNFSFGYVNRQDHFDIIVQYYKGKNFYCGIASIDEEGRMIRPFKTIDSIENTNLDGNDIYGIIQSENKKQLCLMKAFTGVRPGALQLDYLLVDDNLNIVARKKNLIPFDNTINISPLYLDNTGNLIFAEYKNHSLSQTQSTLVTVYKIERDNDTALNTVHEIPGYALKNISIEISNDIDRYIVTGMIQKPGNDSSKTVWEQGIFTSLLNDDLSSPANDTIIFLSQATNFETLTGRVVALNNIIAENNGGYIIACTANNLPKITGNYFARPPSSVVTTYDNPLYIQPDLNTSINKMVYTPTNGSPNPYNNNLSAYNDPESSGYTYSKTSIDQNQSGNNLILFNLNDSNKVNWSLVLDGKVENDVASLINECKGIHTAKALHFVYARMINKNKKAFSEIEIKPNGTYEIKPLIMSDLHYEIQLQLGVQVDNRSIVFPCIAKDKLAFVRIEFE